MFAGPVFLAVAFAAPVVAGAAPSALAGAAVQANIPYVPTRIDSPLQPAHRWGERLVSATLPGPLGGNGVTAGDLNGNGVNDFWTADPFATIGTNANQGRVYAVDGKTKQVIYTIDSPAPQAGAAFGFYISTPGDVNGDGIPDLVVGTDAQNVPVQPGLGGCATPAAPEPNGCNEKQGEAWVFSGATGTLLYALNNPIPQGSPTTSARFGSRIGRAGDINGDGVPDIIVGASNQDVCDTAGCTAAVTAAQTTAGTQANAGDLACGDLTPIPSGCAVNQGQAFIFSGANGALLRTLDLPAADQVPTASTTCTSNCGTFGLAVQSPGDLNADGVNDQLVDAANLTVGGMTGQGRMYLFSGSSGGLLAKIDDPVPQAGATFGFQDAAPNSPGDINGDGVPDIYANGFGQNGPTGAGQGRAWIFDGKQTVATGSGVLLVTVDDPTPELGGQFGWSMTTTSYNNDGKADFYVGQSPHHVAGATGSGGTYIFSGPSSAIAGTAQLLKALELPAADAQSSTPSNLGPNLGWGLAAPGDLDGDGKPDYLAGAPFKDVNGVADAGQIFAFQSKKRPPAADFDGNTTTDFSVFRPSTGSWYINGVTPGIVNFGTSGDIAVPADYNGDGIADVAVFRPSNGTWYIHTATGNNTFADSSLPFGTSGDIPVPADYLGTGSAQIAVFRPSNGTWYVNGGPTTQWGVNGDIPVPGDYLGNGTTQIAVYRPSNGTWYVKGGPITPWGANGDIPEPGDYLGNGTTQIAVFRPSTGTWFVNGGPSLNWGGSGDVPLPLPAASRP
ncbi:MAG: FG-GAP-like repeat-containing protein [Actinomycetota bacterium]|nr:FG-GAP-like repeat-containing protein [Actinomycetota bacterium]